MTNYPNIESQSGGSGRGFRPGPDDWRSLVPNGQTPSFMQPSDLRVGDIILSTSTGLVSEGIREISNSRVSHAYTYVGGNQIIEADADGVVLRTLDEALRDDYYAAAYRIVGGLSSAEQTRLVDFLRDKIGAGYDYQGVASFLTDWVDQDPEKYFCSELVLSAYQTIGRPLGAPLSRTEPGNVLHLGNIRYLGHLKPASMAEARSQALALNAPASGEIDSLIGAQNVRIGDLVMISSGGVTQLAFVLGDGMFGYHSEDSFQKINSQQLAALNPQGVYRHQGMSPDQAQQIVAQSQIPGTEKPSLLQIQGLSATQESLYVSTVIVEAFSTIGELIDPMMKPPSLVGVEYVRQYSSGAPQDTATAPTISPQPSPAPSDVIQASTAQSRKSPEEIFLEIAMQNGGSAEEARAFYHAGSLALTNGSARPNVTFTDGWLKSTLERLVQTFAPTELLPALFSYCNEKHHSVGIGLAGTAGFGAAATGGFGIIIAPGNRVGYYGSIGAGGGWIFEVSLSIQLTVMFGGPELFSGQSVVETVEISPIAGEAFGGGIAKIYTPDSGANRQLIGYTGILSLSAGVPLLSEISLTIIRQDTNTSLGVSHSALANQQYPANVTPIRSLSGDAINVRLRCFIPSPAIMVEPFGNWGGFDMIAFGGDGRNFSYDGGTHRGQINAEVSLSSSGGSVLSQADTDWGMSHRYQTADTYEVSGKPSWWRGIRSGAGHYDRIAKLVRTSDNLNLAAVVSAHPSGDAHGSFELVVNGGLPLLPDLTPNINARMVLHLKRSNGQLQAKLTGGHDGFPSFEVYVNRQRIHHYDPVSVGNSPMSLMGFGTGDRSVDTGWIAIGPSTQSLPMQLAHEEYANCWR